MKTWYEKAEDEIDQELSNGLIDQKEYQRQMRELFSEMQAEAEGFAEDAYNEAMGGW